MTTDSMPIPSWSEVQAALDAHRRRQDEQNKELSTINRLRGAGVAMMAVGFFGGTILFFVSLADEHLDRLRHLTNPYATVLTIGGLFLFVASILYGVNRRHHEDLATRLREIRRHQQRQDFANGFTDALAAEVDGVVKPIWRQRRKDDHS